ncbi:MAG: hypothetical protein HY428_03200 [Candidatus Levybacteria bacterium]|nr:hypothetical protein [Candidatus Levybacteria bacterium]
MAGTESELNLSTSRVAGQLVIDFGNRGIEIDTGQALTVAQDASDRVVVRYLLPVFLLRQLIEQGRIDTSVFGPVLDGPDRPGLVIEIAPAPSGEGRIAHVLPAPPPPTT